MFGAIIGDIVGSRLEFFNYKGKDFELFADDCCYTDDSVMSLAIAKALIECNDDYKNLSDLTINNMRKLGEIHLNAGYGGKFMCWLSSQNPQPYNSYGNGAAMRISAVAYMANTIDEVKELSYKVTSVTHNHPEGLKGAEAIAVAIFLARIGTKKEKIKQYIIDNYYNINFTIDEIRDGYDFDETCQGSVPEALECFFESSSFEDTIRTAISLGGDSDTIGAMAGSIAEAYYGIPSSIKEQAALYLDADLLKILITFENYYLNKLFNIKYGNIET